MWKHIRPNARGLAIGDRSGLWRWRIIAERRFKQCQQYRLSWAGKNPTAQFYAAEHCRHRHV